MYARHTSGITESAITKLSLKRGRRKSGLNGKLTPQIQIFLTNMESNVVVVDLGTYQILFFAFVHSKLAKGVVK